MSAGPYKLITSNIWIGVTPEIEENDIDRHTILNNVSNLPDSCKVMNLGAFKFSQNHTVKLELEIIEDDGSSAGNDKYRSSITMSYKGGSDSWVVDGKTYKNEQAFWIKCFLNNNNVQNQYVAFYVRLIWEQIP